MSKNILITGANRGLGLGVLEKYAKKDNHIVVAAVRDPQVESARRLAEVETGEGTKIVVVKIDSTVHDDAFSAVEEIRKHGISHLDVVVANAGISSIWPLVKDAKIEDIDAHMRTNVYGVVSLYQATRGLLKASVELGREPMFVLMGSSAGSLADQPPIPNAAYGPSKAAAHWYIPRIHAEDPWLNAFVMDPGFVQTDMGQAGAKGLGLENAYLTVEESIGGIMERLGESNREVHGGKYVHWDGKGVDDWRGCKCYQ